MATREVDRPLQRYLESARPVNFATVELHHHLGRDLRGTVFEPEVRSVRPPVEERFGYALEAGHAPTASTTALPAMVAEPDDGKLVVPFQIEERP